MNKNVVIVILGVVIIAGAAFWFGQSQKSSVGDSSNTNTQSEKTNNTTNANTNTATQDVKEFTVTGKNFSFDPTEIKVKQGDKVKITFKNSDGFHDFRIDQFNVATQKLRTGGQETVEFTADKTGTFEYYCSVANHREMGMKGNLIVE